MKIRNIILFMLIFFIAASNILAFPLELNKYGSSLIQNAGINSRIGHESYQSQGVDTLIKVGDNVYILYLNQNDEIVIDILNGTDREYYMSTGIKCANYGSYRGLGSVCTDGNNLYVTYIYADTSVQMKKISLSDKSVFATPLVCKDPKQNFFPVDSIYHNGFVYLLVSNNSNTHQIVKVLDNLSDFPVKTTIPGENITINTLAIANNTLYLYGGIGAPDNYRLYCMSYNLDCVSLNGYIYSGSTFSGAITRSFVYNNEIYALFKNSKSVNSTGNKIIRMSNITHFWESSSTLDFNSLYVDENGVYVGYTSGNKIGYQKWERKKTAGAGKLLEDKFIISQGTPLQSNGIYADSEKAVILTSLSNKDAELSFLPLGTKMAYLYFTGEPNYESSVVSPKSSNNTSDTFTYKVNYVNYKNAPPKTGPKVYIRRDGAELNSNGYTMIAENSSDTNYTDGKIYHFATTLELHDNSKYTYAVDVDYSNEHFYSDEYDGPIYGNKPQILYLEGRMHLFPNMRKFTNTSISAKVKIFEPNYLDIHPQSPEFTIFTESGTAVLTQKMNPIPHSVNGETAYSYTIGKLGSGKYKYMIEAKNINGLEAVPFEGDLEVYAIPSDVSEDNKRSAFNVPNPFAPGRKPTKVIFQGDGGERVNIKIYTLMGDLVYEDDFSAVDGTNEYEYKGYDNSGKPLYNGAYLCYMNKPSGNCKFKMLVVK